MDGVPVLLYCPKPCSKLSFSGFLPSAVSYWNLCNSLMRHYNLNTHNVAFCIFSCRTLSNSYKLLAIIVICNEKQNHGPCKRYFSHHGIFTENFTIFVSNVGETGNVPEFKFDKF